MWKKRNGVLNISVPDTNSKFSPVLRKNLRMVTKISFLPRFKVLTFLVGWFKLGLEVKIKQKNSFYFQTRLVQTCSNLLAERLSKKVLLPCDRIEIMQDFVRMRLDSDYWEIFLSHSFLPAFVRSLMNRKLVQGTKRIFEWFSLLLCSIFQTHVRLLLPRQGGWISGGIYKTLWANFQSAQYCTSNISNTLCPKLLSLSLGSICIIVLNLILKLKVIAERTIFKMRNFTRTSCTQDCQAKSAIIRQQPIRHHYC